MPLIGYHVSIAKSLDLSFDRADASGCTAMQIFVSNPRGWQVRKPDSETIRLFLSKAESSGIKAVAHMPYLPNMASSDKEIRSKSARSLVKNLEACNMLGIKYLVAHLGSHMGHGAERGQANIIETLDAAADSAKGTTILLENQAGHSNSIGAKLADIAHIYEKSALSKEKKLGFCLDTCHLFAAGYDIRHEEALRLIDDELGIDRVYVVHINDAKFELGSGKDRHANIGFGHIGEQGFAKVLGYNGIKDKILILETPADNLSKETEVKLLKNMAHRVANSMH